MKLMILCWYISYFILIRLSMMPYCAVPQDSVSISISVIFLCVIFISFHFCFHEIFIYKFLCDPKDNYPSEQKRNNLSIETSKNKRKNKWMSLCPVDCFMSTFEILVFVFLVFVIIFRVYFHQHVYFHFNFLRIWNRQCRNFCPFLIAKSFIFLVIHRLNENASPWKVNENYFQY